MLLRRWIKNVTPIKKMRRRLIKKATRRRHIWNTIITTLPQYPEEYSRTTETIIWQPLSSKNRLTGANVWWRTLWWIAPEAVPAESATEHRPSTESRAANTRSLLKTTQKVSEDQLPRMRVKWASLLNFNACTSRLVSTFNVTKIF